MSKKPHSFEATTKESNMTGMTNRISRLAAAFGVAAVLAGGAATPSLAYPNERQPFVEFDTNGSLLSSNPGYANEPTVGQSVHHPRTRASEHAPARSDDNWPGKNGPDR